MSRATRRILIAGGSHADIPLILAARRLGYHVTTSGTRKDDLGHACADAYVAADYSDPDAIHDLAVSLRVNAICACCNDFSALSAAEAAHRLGLAGHDAPETSRIIHHKDRWRAYALAAGVPTPWARGFDQEAQALAVLDRLAYPVIVKPVDLTGGKGISRATDPAQARGAVRTAFARSRAGRIVIEEFIEGSRHGFTAILRNRRVAFHFSDDEQYHLNPYLVSGASAPTSSPPPVTTELVRQSERIAADLALVDGIFHVQYIERGGRPVIIEICRRAPGDLYVDLVRHATGAPYAEWIVRAACGLPLDEVAPRPVTACVTRHCLMAWNAGIFRGYSWAPEVAAQIVDRMVWGRIGEQVTDPAIHKFGIVFLRHPDEVTMRRLQPDLQRLLYCDVQPPGL